MKNKNRTFLVTKARRMFFQGQPFGIVGENIKFHNIFKNNCFQIYGMTYVD